MGVRWRVNLLGRLSLTGEGVEITRFRRRATAKLLAYLAYQLDRDIPREELCEVLWPDVDPVVGRRRLSEELASLRRQLEPPGFAKGGILEATRDYVRLSSSSVICDVTEFRALLARAKKTVEPAPRQQVLIEAEACYRGELMPGFYDQWVEDLRAPLIDSYAWTVQRLAELLRADGQVEDAAAYGLKLLRFDPLNEELHESVLKWLLETGQTVTARQVYAHLRAGLAEIGEKPSESVRQMVRAKLGAGLSVEVVKKAPPRPSERTVAPSSPTSSLPYLRNRFFGRDEEIAYVQKALEDPRLRLLTLTGLGGCGKTRLSIEIGERLVPFFGGRVYFASLAEVSDQDGILRSILAAFRLPQVQNPWEAIRHAMVSAETTLLILDNYEHLADHHVDVVSQLLEVSDRLKIVVTSRHRLNLEGEHELPLAPLSLPDEGVAFEQVLQTPSVQLFMNRAQSSRPDFQITEANAATIVAICRRLDGIPLALELAAGWIQTMGIAQIDARLSDRFEFLASRRRDISARHKTLLATLDYSYQLLSDELRRMLGALSVFRGVWSVEAVEEIVLSWAGPMSEATLDVLAELRSRSLLTYVDATPEPGEEASQFRLLETVRDYASRQLTPEEEGELRERHADYFTRLASRMDYINEVSANFRRIEPHLPNFLSALEFLWEREDYGKYTKLMTALSAYWSRDQGGSFAADRLWKILDLAEAGHPISELDLANANGLLSMILNRQERFAESRKHGMIAATMFGALGQDERRAHALNTLAIRAMFSHQFEEAGELLTEVREIAQRIESPRIFSYAIVNLGIVAMAGLDFEHALKNYEIGLDLVDLPVSRIRALENMAHALICLGRFDEAEVKAKAALKLAREVNIEAENAGALLCLAAVADSRDQYRLGLRFSLDALDLYLRYGYKHMARYATSLIAMNLFRQGRYRESVHAFAVHDRELASHWGRFLASCFDDPEMTSDGVIARLKKELGEEEFTYEWIRSEGAGVDALHRRLQAKLALAS